MRCQVKALFLESGSIFRLRSVLDGLASCQGFLAGQDLRSDSVNWGAGLSLPTNQDSLWPPCFSAAHRLKTVGCSASSLMKCFLIGIPVTGSVSLQSPRLLSGSVTAEHLGCHFGVFWGRVLGVAQAGI